MWVVIDEYEGEFEVVNTEEEALKMASSWIDNYRDCDGWPEESDMLGIQIAKVTHGARQINKVHREDWNESKDGEWPNDEWSYVCDYELHKISE